MGVAPVYPVLGPSTSSPVSGRVASAPLCAVQTLVSLLSVLGASAPLCAIQILLSDTLIFPVVVSRSVASVDSAARSCSTRDGSSVLATDGVNIEKRDLVVDCQGNRVPVRRQRLRAVSVDRSLKGVAVLDTSAPHREHVWGVLHGAMAASFVKQSYPQWKVVPDVCKAACGPECRLMFRRGDGVAEVSNLLCVCQVVPTSGIYQPHSWCGKNRELRPRVVAVPRLLGASRMRWPTIRGLTQPPLVQRGRVFRPRVGT